MCTEAQQEPVQRPRCVNNKAFIVISWHSVVPQGIVQSAFLWGYLGTNVLGGQLADAHGGGC